MKHDILVGAVCFQEYHGSYSEFLDLAKELKLHWVELKYEPPICLMDGSGRFREIRGKAADYGIGLSLHTPFVGLNIASFDTGERDLSINRIKGSLVAASEMDIKAATVHGGFLRAVDYSADNWKKSEELNILGLQELSRFSRDLGITLCLENGNAFKAGQIKHALHPGAMKAIRREVGDSLGFTVDFGHAMYFSLNPSYLVSELNPDNVKLSHLHSNNQLEDSHSPLGSGLLQYRRVIERYAVEKWEFPLSIEMKSESDLRVSVNAVNSCISELEML